MTGRHIRTLFDTASRAGLLVVAFAAAAVLVVVALAVGSRVLAFIGLAVAIALAGLLAGYLIVAERRRHEAAERELTSEARFLESLVETMGALAGSPDVLERTRAAAERLSAARTGRCASGPRWPRPVPGTRHAWLGSSAVAEGNRKYLLFVWKPSGYELREAEGEVPSVGSDVEADDQTQQVTKVAPSPLPNDTRPCVYLQAL